MVQKKKKKNDDNYDYDYDNDAVRIILVFSMHLKCQHPGLKCNVM